VAEYVARCTIWVGPPAVPTDAAKQAPGSFYDNITKMPEEAQSVVPKSQMADVFIVSELACVILRCLFAALSATARALAPAPAHVTMYDFSCSFIVDGGNSSAGCDSQRYFSFSMVFDLSLMNSLQPILYALSDRINRISRFFGNIMGETSRSNLEE
jgi:hypothetical protein